MFVYVWALYEYWLIARKINFWWNITSDASWKDVQNRFSAMHPGNLHLIVLQNLPYAIFLPLQLSDVYKARPPPNKLFPEVFLSSESSFSVFLSDSYFRPYLYQFSFSSRFSFRPSNVEFSLIFSQASGFAFEAHSGPVYAVSHS